MVVVPVVLIGDGSSQSRNDSIVELSTESLPHDH